MTRCSCPVCTADRVVRRALLILSCATILALASFVYGVLRATI